MACFGGSRMATGNPEPAPPKHVELSTTRILRAMSYGFATLWPCVGLGLTFAARRARVRPFA